MIDRTIGAEDLNRLKRERDEADRQYNDALTALDRVIQALPVIPQPPPAFDATQIDELQRLADDTADPPGRSGGWWGWARRLIWPVLRPPLARQEQINRALIDHLTHNLTTHQATTKAIASSLTLLRDECEALRTFQSRLVVWAQQITPYVDTKDREATGLIRRINENPVRLLERTIGLLQQRQLAVKRQLEQLLAAPTTAAGGDTTAPCTVTVGDCGSPAAVSGSLDAYKYLSFEQAFRGTETDIARRLEHYRSRFDGASEVLDVGCGRGEFLDILRERGVSGRGVDTNHEMVTVCRERGLDVMEGDAVGYLDSIPDGSLGGLIATQVVEHFRSDYLIRFLELSYHKLRPGSTIIIETLNVDSWSAFFGPYLRDITHERPLPSETLRFLLEASGFQRIELQFSSPADDAAKLRTVELPVSSPEEVATLVETFNANVERINTLLFTFLDYAAIGQKL